MKPSINNFFPKSGAITALLAALSVVTVVGCSSTSKDEVATGETKAAATAAAHMDRNRVVTVEFNRGQQGLSANATAEIEKALREARMHGEIDNVDVAVWSDMQYPAEGKTLPKSQVDLADARAKNLEKFIDRIEPKSDVKTYNMAKQPNAFQKWVSTRDAEVKSKLTAAGVTSRTVSNEIIYDRASKAMVFIEIR